jgi:Protein of unknown function (DUF3298)
MAGNSFSFQLGRGVVCLAFALLAGCSGFGRPSPIEGRHVTIGTCSPTPCVKVDLGGTPSFIAQLAPEVETKIQTEIAAALYASIDVESATPSRDALLQEVDDRYREYSQISDAPIDWSLTRRAVVLAETSEVVSVEVFSEGYLGGAHGFSDRILMTFDAQTGSRLSVGDIVDESSRGMLVRVIEAEFRRARKVERGQSLQDAGFFILPGQEMPISDNFAITSDGLQVQYNPYEIAPYSMGATRVLVPWEALEPLLKSGRLSMAKSDTPHTMSR